jgi:hypothetical protein
MGFLLLGIDSLIACFAVGALGNHSDEIRISGLENIAR